MTFNSQLHNFTIISDYANTQYKSEAGQSASWETITSVECAASAEKYAPTAWKLAAVQAEAMTQADKGAVQ